MKLVFASDSFKGSLTSGEIARLLRQAAQEVFGEVECVCLDVADGGEGTAGAVLSATGGRWIESEVLGPLGAPVKARYAALDGRRAVIEMAEASGLTLVPADQRDPLQASTFGTGQLILDALSRGFTQIAVGIGGSATNDGGMGCARALGARFLDGDGHELAGRGEDLERVRDIDLSGLDARLKAAEITAMCDVRNPLCGPEGATRVFGPQKGATPKMVKRLEAGMENYRDVLRRCFSVDADAIPGAGAAGGLGAALSVLLGASLQPGVETVLDLIGFKEHLDGAALVVTGEGRADGQSRFGKVMRGVGERAGRRGVPVVGLCGALGEGCERLYAHGIDALMCIADGPMTLEDSMARAKALYLAAARRMFRLMKTGMGMG